MIHIDFSICAIILHLVFIHSHILQTMTTSSLAISVISTFTSCAESFFCGLDALAEDGVLDEAEIGGQDFFVDFVYDCDGIFGVCREGADLAPVAGGALFFKILERG
jgi:hypothetical protein